MTEIVWNKVVAIAALTEEEGGGTHVWFEGGYSIGTDIPYEAAVEKLRSIEGNAAMKEELAARRQPTSGAVSVIAQLEREIVQWRNEADELAKQRDRARVQANDFQRERDEVRDARTAMENRALQAETRCRDLERQLATVAAEAQEYAESYSAEEDKRFQAENARDDWKAAVDACQRDEAQWKAKLLEAQTRAADATSAGAQSEARAYMLSAALAEARKERDVWQTACAAARSRCNELEGHAYWRAQLASAKLQNARASYTEDDLLDLLKKFASGEGGRRSGELLKRGWIKPIVLTDEGWAQIGQFDWCACGHQRRLHKDPTGPCTGPCLHGNPGASCDCKAFKWKVPG